MTFPSIVLRADGLDVADAIKCITAWATVWRG
jgi:hypothetical protein